MSVRPVQQRPVVVAVGRIQEGGQEYTDVYIGIVKRSQNIAVVFATRTMEVGVNDHGIESPFQANASAFPAVFGGKGVSSCGQRDYAVNAMYRASEDASDGISMERLLVRAL